MKSIKTKIIVSIIACTLLSSIPIGIMSLRNVYQTSSRAAEQELALKCRNEQEQIQGKGGSCTQVQTKEGEIKVLDLADKITADGRKCRRILSYRADDTHFLAVPAHTAFTQYALGNGNSIGNGSRIHAQQMGQGVIDNIDQTKENGELDQGGQTT